MNRSSVLFLKKVKTSFSHFTLIAALSSPASLTADSQYWGAESGNFSDPDNWFSGAVGILNGAGAVPGSDDRAVFWSVFHPEMTITDDQNRAIQTLYVGRNQATLMLGGNTMTLRENDSFASPAEGTFVLGHLNGHQGGLTLLDGTIASRGEVVIGASTGTNHTLTIGDDGYLDTHPFSFVPATPNNLHVGVAGIGNLFANDGGKIRAGDLRVGIDDGSIGTFSLNATGSNGTRTDLLGDAIFGEKGTGFGVISNGATLLTSGSSSIGAHSASTKSSLVTLQSGGSWLGNEFKIGGLAGGRLTLSGGSTASGSTFIVDGNTNGTTTGQLDLQSNSRLNVSEDLIVGNFGTSARLEVLSGSDIVIQNDFEIGLGTGSKGTILLDGEGSTIDLRSGWNFDFGRLGEAEMTISGGADFFTSRMRLGTTSTDNSVDVITLTGLGSTWTNSGICFIGSGGLNELTVANGARFAQDSSVDIILGKYTTGMGHVILTGDQSQVTAGENNVIVGDQSTRESVFTIQGDASTTGKTSPPKLTTENLIIGQNLGSKGKLEIINGNGTESSDRVNLDLANDLIIAASGEGAFDLHRGKLDANNLIIAEGSQSLGLFKTDQAQTTIAKAFTIAKSGVASVLLQDSEILLGNPALWTIAESLGAIATLNLNDSTIKSTTSGNNITIPQKPIIGRRGSAFFNLLGASKIQSDGPIFAKEKEAKTLVSLIGGEGDQESAEWLIGANRDQFEDQTLIGDQGEALLRVRKGLFQITGSARGHALILGENSGAKGTIELEDEGVLKTNDEIFVGNGGFGKIHLQANSLLTASILTVGNQSRGELLVESTAGDTLNAARISNTLSAGIGTNGSADLQFNNGHGSADTLLLAIDGGDAELTISGSEAKFTSTKTSAGTRGNSTIGKSGNATGTVRNGGKFIIENNLTLGDEASGDGTLVTSGIGSYLNVHARLDLGKAGRGELRVLNNSRAESSFLTISGGSEATISSNAILSVSGLLEIGTNGKISLTNDGILAAHTIDGDLVNTSGILSPGSHLAAFKDLWITGSYQQADQATLQLELGGTDLETNYDQLSVSSEFTCAGTLQVSLVNNFEPELDDLFFTVQASNITGAFTEMILPDLSPGLEWEVIQTFNQIALKVVSNDQSPLAAWREEFGLAANGSQDHQDQSGNGLANILSFAFGLGDPSSAEVPSANAESKIFGIPSIHKSQTPGRIYFDFVRHRSQNRGISYLEQISDNLKTWSSLKSPPQNTLFIEEINFGPRQGGDYDFIRLELDADLAPNFLRIRIAVD